MFSWDETKREKVISEHKIDFAGIVDIFEDPFSIDFIDDEHSSEGEQRFAKIGITARYDLIFLVYISIDPKTAHFITARRAENYMVKEYEKRKRY
jgi:uncharacterized DUF497 family protein